MHIPYLRTLFIFLFLSACGGPLTITLNIEGQETSPVLESNNGCCSQGLILYQDADNNEAVRLEPYFGSFRVGIERFEWQDSEFHYKLADSVTTTALITSFEFTDDEKQPLILHGEFDGKLATKPAGTNTAESEKAFTGNFDIHAGNCVANTENLVCGTTFQDKSLVGMSTYSVQVGSIFGQTPTPTTNTIANEFWTKGQIKSNAYPVTLSVDDAQSTTGNGSIIDCIKYRDNAGDDVLLCAKYYDKVKINSCDYEAFIAIDHGIAVRASAKPLLASCGQYQEVTFLYSDNSAATDTASP